jgi:hypothetical protein
MGGGRIPGPICAERLGDDPILDRGFTDAIPLGGGSGSAGSVVLAGWPRSLAWSDFPEVATRPAGATEAAQISTEVVQPDRVDIARAGGSLRLSSYTVRVRLVRDECWVVADQKSDALLVHEQGHYDITGLTARDMVAALAGVRASSAADLQQQVTDIIAAAGALASSLTSLYDGSASGGTNNGRDAAAQARWNTHLANCRQNNTRLIAGP